jgi:hypothetical protein
MVKFIIGFLVPCSVCLPLFIAFSRYRHLHVAMKVIVLYLLLSGLVSILSIAISNNGINNMPLLHIYTVAEFVLILLFFRVTSIAGVSKRTFALISLLFILLNIVNILFLQNLFTYNSYSRTMEAIIIMVFSLQLFYRLIGNEDVLRLRDSGITWINSGIFLYFSGSFILFFFSEFLSKEFMFYKIAWVVHAILVLFMYLLFAAGFLFYKKAIPPHSTG